MAKKRKAYLHVGMPGVGDVVEAASLRHRDALAELGVRVPAKTADELFRAAVEILRAHRDWGFRRSEVEGAWAHLCRRAQKGRGSVLVSQPLLAAAEPEQIDLLVDGLAGFEVHVVVTTTAPHAWTVPGEPDTDLGLVLERWAHAVRKPERLHVVLLDDEPGAQAKTAKRAWKQVGKVVGFGTASLSVEDLPRPAGARSPSPVRGVPESRRGVLETLAAGWAERIAHGGFDVRGDLAVLTDGLPAEADAAGLGEVDRALRDALRDVERLTRRNEALETRLAEVERKRRKLKRLLASEPAARSDPDAA